MNGKTGRLPWCKARPVQHAIAKGCVGFAHRAFTEPDYRSMVAAGGRLPAEDTAAAPRLGRCDAEFLSLDIIS
jgi:hypothetical protein